jgi:Uma2 family endonuclease
VPVSEETYRQLALEDPEGHWELHCGSLRRKPDMTVEHNDVATRLFARLVRQLDENAFMVRANMGRLRRSAEQYYIPDLCVIPAELIRPLRGRRVLDMYDAPLPLVVEIWSPSTGDYDVDTKLPEYRRRGDIEIWRIHPYERTLTSSRRQPDGSYADTVHTSGTVRPVALPSVAIDVETLFD